MTAKILVVDDEPDVTHVFRQQFRAEIRAEEYSFLFAGNGLEALEIIEKYPEIGLVLSDINMPKMDGLTLLRELKSRDDRIQVVMITAYGDMENIRGAMNAGAFDFLNKPFTRRDLKITVANGLARVLQIQQLAAAKREQQQAQYEALQHLQRMDRIKDEFLANTSHELYTPLNGMIGLAESLLDGAAGPLNDQVSTNLWYVLASAKRLTSLVNDILDFSRLKNGDLKLELRPCNVGQMVQFVMELSKPLIGDKNLELHNDIGSQPVWVQADENRLQQILHNLVGNAIKFTKEGQIRITCKVHGPMLEVAVRDTGIGIAAGETEDIFNLFEQLKGSTSRKHGGTGLGLAITKKLVHLQGGEIWVESELTQGSIFYFSVPLWDQPMAEVDHSGTIEPDRVPMLPLAGRHQVSQPILVRPASQPEKALRIFVADDELVNLQVLINQLTIRGYRVTVASDGNRAWEMLQENSEYDLVMLDVMMPGLSGYELCRKLRERHSLYDLPILMLTAKNRPQDVLTGLEAGANDYVAKPFDKQELLARVKNLITLKKAVIHAIEQAGRLESERSQREFLELLRHLTEDLTATLDLREVLHRFMDHLAEEFAMSRCLVVFHHGERTSVVPDRQFPSGKRAELDLLQDAIFTWTQSIAREGCALIMNPAEVQACIGCFDLPCLQGCWLGVPLLSRNKIIGTAILVRKEEAAFNPGEMELATTLAKQAAIAIVNAQLYEEVKRLAITDGLTGLYNRRYFFEEGNRQLEQARDNGRPLSLIMLDIDHFKRFNDEFGHAVGDSALIALAKAIRTFCRQSDIAGRYGGEEIAILLPDTNSEEALLAAERLRTELMNQPVVSADFGSISMTASLGVSVLTKSDKRLESLVARADQALYRAKSAGRNQVCFQDQVVTGR